MLHEMLLVISLMIVAGTIGSLLTDRKWMNNAARPGSLVVNGKKFKVVEVVEQ